MRLSNIEVKYYWIQICTQALLNKKDIWNYFKSVVCNKLYVPHYQSFIYNFIHTFIHTRIGRVSYKMDDKIMFSKAGLAQYTWTHDGATIFLRWRLRANDIREKDHVTNIAELRTKNTSKRWNSLVDRTLNLKMKFKKSSLTIHTTQSFNKNHLWCIPDSPIKFKK